MKKCKSKIELWLLLPLFFVVFIWGFNTELYAQNVTYNPDDILVAQRKQPTVLLVGSFHFAYYNLDAHKVAKENQMDILSEQKQKELKELLDYIYRFKPTKIAVESGRNTGYLMKKYREWKKGDRALGKDEREQIGFRILEKFGLDTIYGVDDQGLVLDLYDGSDSLSFRPVLDTIYADWDFQSDDTISKAYSQYYKKKDALILQMNLLDYFKLANSDKNLNRGYGVYLVGDFKLGDTRGADALAMHWYSRNLRIFRHIQQISTSPEDRILVLYGTGHIEILKHLFECSPEYKLIKFSELK